MVTQQKVLVLSVLSIPELDPNIEPTKFGLWNSGTQSYECIGTEDECYAKKDLMERMEQSVFNNQWKNRVYASRMQLLTKAGMSKSRAAGIVNKSLGDFALS